MRRYLRRLPTYRRTYAFKCGEIMVGSKLKRLNFKLKNRGFRRFAKRPIFLNYNKIYDFRNRQQNVFRTVNVTIPKSLIFCRVRTIFMRRYTVFLFELLYKIGKRVVTDGGTHFERGHGRVCKKFRGVFEP